MGSSMSDTGAVEQTRHAGGDDRGGVVVPFSYSTNKQCSGCSRWTHVVGNAYKDTSEVGGAGEVTCTVVPE